MSDSDDLSMRSVSMKLLLSLEQIEHKDYVQNVYSTISYAGLGCKGAYVMCALQTHAPAMHAPLE